MTPQEIYRIICEKLREVESLERELIINNLKQEQGGLAKLKLFLYKNSFKIYLSLLLIPFFLWLIFGVLLKAEKADKLAIQEYLVIGLILTVVVSVFNGFLVKFTPKSEMESHVKFSFAAQGLQKQTYLRTSEAKRRLEEAVNYYQKQWQFLYYILLFCIGILIDSVSSNSDFFKAILLLSPLKIYQASEVGAWALLTWLVGGFIYLKQCALPCAWIQNTARQIRITN